MNSILKSIIFIILFLVLLPWAFIFINIACLLCDPIGIYYQKYIEWVADIL